MTSSFWFYYDFFFRLLKLSLDIIVVIQLSHILSMRKMMLFLERSSNIRLQLVQIWLSFIMMTIPTWRCLLLGINSCAAFDFFFFVSSEKKFIKMLLWSQWIVVWSFNIFNINVIVSLETCQNVPEIYHLKGKIVENQKNGGQMIALRLFILASLLSSFLRSSTLKSK